MQGPALLILLVAATAWLAPVVQAMRHGKTQIAAAWLCSAPLGVGVYILHRDPKLALGILMAIIIGGGLVWRNVTPK